MPSSFRPPDIHMNRHGTFICPLVIHRFDLQSEDEHAAMRQQYRNLPVIDTDAMLACRRGSEHIPAISRNYADRPLRKPRSDGFDMLFTRLIWMQTCIRNHDPRHIKSGRDDQCRSPRGAIESA